jgi:hypothetical protein
MVAPTPIPALMPVLRLFVVFGIVDAIGEDVVVLVGIAMPILFANDVA